jgi:hypothetical protein
MGQETHGGSSLVCRESAGQGAILSAQLFDLWEATLPPPLGLGLTAAREEKDFEAQLTLKQVRIARANPAFAAELGEKLESVRQAKYMIPAHLRLERIDDLESPVILPRGCYVEQLAVYFDPDDRLLIDPNLFGALSSETDRAAFYLHEALYKLFRQKYGELIFRTRTGTRTLRESSRPVRRMIGFLFSPLEPEPLLEGLSPQAVHCTGKFFDFHVTPEGEVLFSRLGIPLPTRTSAGGRRDHRIRGRFAPLGDGATFHFQWLDSPRRARAETRGGFLQIPPEELECR